MLAIGAVCRGILRRTGVQFTLLGVIVINAIVLGFETSPDWATRNALALRWFHMAVGVVFVVEVLTRIASYAPHPLRFFRDGWNTFDFVVVALSLVPGTGSVGGVARIARFLRLIRLVTALPELRLIVGTMLRSVRSLAYVGGLLMLFLYIYALVGVTMFGAIDPQRWSSLGAALLTLFQVLTLEGWIEAQQAVLIAKPWAWVYFTSFIVVAVFIVVNLFIAVVVNNLDSVKAAEPHASRPERPPRSSARIALRLRAHRNVSRGAAARGRR